MSERGLRLIATGLIATGLVAAIVVVASIPLWLPDYGESEMEPGPVAVVEVEPLLYFPTAVSVLYPESTHLEYMASSFMSTGAFKPWECSAMWERFGAPLFASPSPFKADVEAELRGQGRGDIKVSICLAYIHIEDRTETE